MRYAYWIITNELCGRAGPNEEPWSAQELFDAGIRAVLSVNKGDGVVPRDFTKLGMSYKCVPLPINTPPTAKDLKSCLRKLPKAYQFAREQTDSGRPLLVHCRHGNDRTGLFLAYYLARRYAMTAEQAIEEVRSRRAACLSAHGWQRFARELIGQVTPTPVIAE